MKRLFCVLLICFMTLVGCGEGDTPDTETSTEAATTAAQSSDTQVETDSKPHSVLKVMSFNVYRNNINTTAKNNTEVSVVNTIYNRMNQLNDMLKGEDIDIAGFQELSETWRTYFGNKLHGDYAYVGAITRDTSEAGYIVYKKNKFEVLESGAFWLVDGAPTTYDKSQESNFDRMCSWAIIKVKATGEIFIFMDTHLDTADAARSKQATVICAQTQALKNAAENRYGISSCPLILVGDMNSTNGSEPYLTLVSRLRDARKYSEGDTVDPTHSTAGGFQCCESEADVMKTSHVIDYIFVSRSITVNNYKMIYANTNLCPYGAYMSDHNAVIAQLTI